MRVVMLFILLCIKLGFPKFFKFYEFLKDRFRPCRRHRQNNSKGKKSTQGLFSDYQDSLPLATMWYNKTAVEYYSKSFSERPPTDLEWWVAWFILCSFISVFTVCMMWPSGGWFQCLSGATLLYLFWQVVINYVSCP
ncbi:hypothetical protein V8C42DRAFT_347530 [Trichoderma barbatum]